MADDDIKPDAEESAEEVEAVAAETAVEGDQVAGETTTKQPEEAATEPPADEAQAVAEAADLNLSDSDDVGAGQSESENVASGDGNDAPVAESSAVAGDTDAEMGAKIFSAWGEIAPAMGMIGTLAGLVIMLGNMSDPKAIGPAMAVALLTTMYGAILANVICCLLYTSPSPRDYAASRMPSSA